MRLRTAASPLGIFRPPIRRILLDNGFSGERWVGKVGVQFNKDFHVVTSICPEDTDLTYEGSDSNNKLRITSVLSSFTLFAKK
jgi:hypothetical protein